MVLYRRNRVPGATYFFTVTLFDRHSGALCDHIGELRSAMRYCSARHPFSIVAMVVLPEHLHCVWTLPENDSNYSTRWLLIKAAFTRATGSGCAKGGRGRQSLWQPRFWEHTIRDDRDLERHVDYIHFNPVKHGCVARVRDWPYSSFHRYVRAQMLPEDWGGDVRDDGDGFGFGE